MIPPSEHEASYQRAFHIRRLLRSVVNYAGFPPCLVLERGLYTVADMMAHGPIPLIDCCSLFQSVDFSHVCKK